MEEEKPGIADEVALGVTYNEIDDYLEGKQVSPEAQATIEKWWYKGQHKRHLPITVFDHFGSDRNRSRVGFRIPPFLDLKGAQRAPFKSASYCVNVSLKTMDEVETNRIFLLILDRNR